MPDEKTYLMTSKAEKQNNNQIKLTVTIDPNEVEAEYDSALNEFSGNIEVKGFRKGKAPKELVEKNMDKAKFNSYFLEQLVSKYYSQAVKEHRINPISQPKIVMKRFEPQKGKVNMGEVIFEAVIAEKPTIKIGDYKKALKGLKGSPPKQKTIYGPDGKPLKESGADKTPHITASQVLEKLIKISQVDIPDVLIEQEVERMIARLLDQTQKLGISIDQYMASQGKTPDKLRDEYRKQAEDSLKAEFVLHKIAELESLNVSDKEIEDSIEAAPDDRSKKELLKPENRWYIKSVLLKNKTLRRLLEIAES